MSVEVRKVDDHVYDGTTGAEVDTVTRYEMGAEIDGVWVSFASKSGDYVSGLQERHKASQQTQQTQQTPPEGDLGAPSMAANAAPHDQQG